LAAGLAALLAGCASTAPAPDTAPARDATKSWKPIGNRKARVVQWGIIHNHAKGKWDAVLKLTNDFELVGWVDDRASKAMRMHEPDPKPYAKYPCFTPQQVFDEVKPDLIVVECPNSELVGVATEIAKHGIPMHMDKPLGTDQVGFARMSQICETLSVPLQIGYMFRANPAINKIVELAKDGTLGEIYAIDADLDHNYGYPKYPEYATHYPGGTAYLLTCHVIEWAMPIFDDALPLKTYSIIKPAPGDPDWAATHTLTIMEYPRANVTVRVCSRGTQSRRHIAVYGANGCAIMDPIEDFTKVKHETGGLTGTTLKNLVIQLTLKEAKNGYKKGFQKIELPSAEDRYAGQLQELARILRGEIPYPKDLYRHDRLVHKVSLDACNLPTVPME